MEAMNRMVSFQAVLPRLVITHSTEVGKDELATLERAKRACAAVAHKSGAKVCAGFVLPSNFKPSEEEDGGE